MLKNREFFMKIRNKISASFFQKEPRNSKFNVSILLFKFSKKKKLIVYFSFLNQLGKKASVDCLAEN